MDPWQAVDGRDCIQEHQAQDFTDPRHRLPSGQRRGIVLFGRVDDGECHGVQEVVGVPDARQVHCETLLDRRIRQPLGDAIPMGLGRDGFPKAGQVVLAVRMLHVREECGPFAHERHATSEHVTGRPHGRGINLGLREQAPTEQHHNVLGVDCAVAQHITAVG